MTSEPDNGKCIYACVYVSSCKLNCAANKNSFEERYLTKYFIEHLRFKNTQYAKRLFMFSKQIYLVYFMFCSLFFGAARGEECVANSFYKII